MFTLRFWACISLSCLSASLWAGEANAQSCLVLSPPKFAPNGSVTLELSLFSLPGKAPAAVQWTLQYTSSNITKLIVDDGPALALARKTALCSGNANAYNCLVAGSNANAIGNGIVAKLTVGLVAGTAAAPISIYSPLGVSGEGYFVPVSSKVVHNPGAGLSPIASQGCEGRGLK